LPRSLAAPLAKSSSTTLTPSEALVATPRASEASPRPGDAPGVAGSRRASRSAVSPLAILLAAALILGAAARLVASDVAITADEDNWMRRAGGFTYGLLNGQFGRTYQNGHPGVTTMWITLLTLGPDRTVEFADRVHNQRFVGRVPGFWEALVDARLGFAVSTSVLVALIAIFTWRLFGPVLGILAAILVGLEPFFLAISQLVHMDAVLSGCMVASVLAGLVRTASGGHVAWVALSGLLAGLSLLSKSPAVYLALFVPALLILGGSGADTCKAASLDLRRRLPQLVGGPDSSRPVSSRLIDLAIWSGTTLLTIVALWPAIWVLGPSEVLDRIAAFTSETGGRPHEAGTFFLGSPMADPGPRFYPVALAFRLAPLTILGLVALVFSWPRAPATWRPPVHWLVAYCLGFGLMMTLGAKKLDRYILPLFPALGVLAAVGLHAVATRWSAHTRSAGPRAVAALALAALVIWPAASAYPYFLSYYNPLLGGGAAAQRAVMVGNGEGLDQVANWINAQPNAENLWVVAHSYDILQPMMLASGEPLRDRVPSNADYVVLYLFQTQIGHSPRVLAEYWDRHEPDLRVWINGIEYARIYRGPHLASPNPFSRQAPSASGRGLG
jgi:hypothetical protein